MVDFFRTLFTGGLNFNKGIRNRAWRRFDPSAPWSATNKAWKIDTGWFKGSAKQIISRFTYEYPQMLFGWLTMGFYNMFYGVDSVEEYKGATVAKTYRDNWGAFSLGSYITGDRTIFDTPGILDHEYGHYKQSMLLGPAYLYVIAIPSAIATQVYDNNDDYHAFYTEAWADYWATTRTQPISTNVGGSKRSITLTPSWWNTALLGELYPKE